METANNGPVVSVGECMVELARGADGRFGQAFGPEQVLDRVPARTQFGGDPLGQFSRQWVPPK